jgi:hypothetical protein
MAVSLHPVVLVLVVAALMAGKAKAQGLLNSLSLSTVPHSTPCYTVESIDVCKFESATQCEAEMLAPTRSGVCETVPVNKCSFFGGVYLRTSSNNGINRMDIFMTPACDVLFSSASAANFACTNLQVNMFCAPYFVTCSQSK